MPPERWVRRRFRLPEESVETFCAELWADRPLGIELRDGSLDVYYREDETPSWSGEAPGASVELIAEAVVEAEDWLAAWRSAAMPFPLGARFWVDPRECDREVESSASGACACDGDDDGPSAVRDGDLETPPAGRHRLRLPARRAFGTGSHASTRLAVAWLEDLPLAGRDVLDFGAGSGILALVAARLGARLVVGAERELESVLVAGANRRLNGIAIALVGASVAALAPSSFDLVVANLLLAELEPELHALAACLDPRGELVYSGALAIDRDRVTALGRSCELRVVGEKIDGEWAAWRLRREEPA